MVMQLRRSWRVAVVFSRALLLVVTTKFTRVWEPTLLLESLHSLPELRVA